MNNNYNDRNSWINSQIKEIDEAIYIGSDLLNDIDYAIKNFSSAQGFATFDAFTKKGLFTHLLKYNKINKAQDSMRNIEFKLKNFENELNDIQLSFKHSLNNYSDGLKIVDFFFDNIFTDLFVRSKIKEDKESLINLRRKIEKVLNDLKNQKKELKRNF